MNAPEYPWEGVTPCIHGIQFDCEQCQREVTTLDVSTNVSGSISAPCHHGKLYNCLPCDVYELNLRIYDLEDEVQRLKRKVKKLKKQ